MKTNLFFTMLALVCLMGTKAWALELDATGVYQIGTAEDLLAFSELVNNGEYSANAVMTADIDLGDISYFPPIGTLCWPSGPMLSYKGIFDGQGHVIYNLSIDKDVAGAETGLFGRLDGATVQNIGIVNATLKNSSALRAGVLGGCAVNSTIINCFTTGNIMMEECICSFNRKNGDGLFGLITSGSVISNCFTTYATMHDDGDSAGSSIENCYWGEEANAWAPTGELCYKLNGDQSDIVWYQTIGEDAHPVLDTTHGKVYTTAETRCDGKIIGEGTFTNDVNQASVTPEHKFEDGICIICGLEDPNVMIPDADGFYNISNGKQLVWFANTVNSGKNDINARLTADIDMSSESQNFRPIGCESAIYSGIFDGQGHRIMNLSISLAQECVGFFGVVQSPVVIKNFIFDKSCSIECGGHFSGLVARARKGGSSITIEQVGMEGDIHLTGWNGALFVGQSYGDALIIRNCYATGSLTADAGYSGAISAWADSNERTLIENCWVISEISGTDNPETFFVRGMGAGTVRNCYCKYGTQVPNITDEQLANGALCYLLNGDQSEISWYQTLGEDAIPVWDASHGVVFTTAERRCDGKVIGEGTYTNNASQASVIPEHNYENGECIVCGQKQEGFIEPDAEGFYNISEASQLVWFAATVNNGATSINARLTGDIDMTDFSNKFQPIGSETAIYTGTFDGQGYRIKNLNISVAHDCGGFFGVIQSPAVIKNFIFDESSSIDCSGYFSGLIGRARKGGGSITIEQVGVEGNIHLTGWNGALFVGQSYGDALIIRNCYATGSLTADAGYSGAICAWADSNEGTLIENCWVISEISGTDNPETFFVRGMGAGTVRNCYCKYGTQVPNITDEQLTSGELCTLLNQNDAKNVFRQNVGEDSHPVFDQAHGIVKYITDAGYATMYLPETSVTIPAGVEAFTGTIAESYLVLNPIASVVMKGQAVVLKGVEGYYSFIPTDAGVGLIQSDLVGTAEPLETNGSQYVLAKKDDKVGFYKAEGTIPAGKAYLVSSNGVKGFVFSYDEGTGISSIENGELIMDNAIYNVAGQRINKIQKGINIVNGKKVLF